MLTKIEIAYMLNAFGLAKHSRRNKPQGFVPSIEFFCFPKRIFFRQRITDVKDIKRDFYFFFGIIVEACLVKIGSFPELLFNKRFGALPCLFCDV